MTWKDVEDEQRLVGVGQNPHRLTVAYPPVALFYNDTQSTQAISIADISP